MRVFFAQSSWRAFSAVLFFTLFIWSSQAAAPALAAETPEAAVADIQAALDQGDLPRFERRVDVDGLSKQGATIFIDLLRRAGEKKSASLPPALALMGGAAQSPETAATLRSILAGEVAAFVRDGVESGRFGGKPAKAGSGSRGMLAPLLADVSTGRKSLRIVGKASPASPDGGAVSAGSADSPDSPDSTGSTGSTGSMGSAPGKGGAAVELPVAVRDAGNGKDYRVRLRMEQRQGLWKVTRIADLPDIASVLWKEATTSE